MASKRKRKEAADRLSSLPDGIILQILSFLDMTHVVRTSLLSNRWRNLWTSIPNLHFNDHSSKFIDRTLLNHTASKIHKFQLYLPHQDSISDVDLWTCFAVRKGVEELDLDMCRYKLPYWIFKCKTLVSLKLSNCTIRIPDFEFFSSLTTLSLNTLNLPDWMLRGLLAGCPLLEDLVVKGCSVSGGLSICSSTLKHLTVDDSVMHRVEVNAPNLQIMKFFEIIVAECCFRGLSSLSKAYLDIHYDYDLVDADSHDLSSFKSSIQDIRHAQVLELSTFFIQAMRTPTFKDLHSYILKTKCLILQTALCQFELPGIANLLWSSPDLENLIINWTSSYRVYVCDIIDEDDQTSQTDFDERKYWESLTVLFPCLVHRLKSIKITDFICDARNSFGDDENIEKGINLVRFLLRNAMVLEKLTIHVSPCRFITKKEERQKIMLKVAQRLISIPRASPHVDVSFLYE